MNQKIDPEEPEQTASEEASPASKEVQLLSLEEARQRLLVAMAGIFDREERVVAFLLELRPIEGSWEVVEMARNCGENYEEFWRMGVGEWLSRDDEGERFTELSRVYRQLTTTTPEQDDSPGRPTQMSDPDG